MIRAVIFDMDGVMIDSEPFWQETEKAVFAEIGIKLQQVELESTMGMRIDAVVAYWLKKRPWDTTAFPPKSVENRIIHGVSKRVRELGKPLPGLFTALELIESCGLPIGLATSSDQRIIDAVLECFNIRERFKICVSARNEISGKPAPDVYLTAAKLLQVPSQNCLAIEDSANGLRAAIRAGMRSIAIPRPEYPDDEIFEQADYRLTSLDELKPEMFS